MVRIFPITIRIAPPQIEGEFDLSRFKGEFPFVVEIAAYRDAGKQDVIASLLYKFKSIFTDPTEVELTADTIGIEEGPLFLCTRYHVGVDGDDVTTAKLSTRWSALEDVVMTKLEAPTFSKDQMGTVLEEITLKFKEMSVPRGTTLTEVELEFYPVGSDTRLSSFKVPSNKLIPVKANGDIEAGLETPLINARFALGKEFRGTEFRARFRCVSSGYDREFTNLWSDFITLNKVDVGTVEITSESLGLPEPEEVDGVMVYPKVYAGMNKLPVDPYIFETSDPTITLQSVEWALFDNEEFLTPLYSYSIPFNKDSCFQILTGMVNFVLSKSRPTYNDEPRLDNPDAFVYLRVRFRLNIGNLGWSDPIKCQLVRNKKSMVFPASCYLLNKDIPLMMTNRCLFYGGWNGIDDTGTLYEVAVGPTRVAFELYADKECTKVVRTDLQSDRQLRDKPDAFSQGWKNYYTGADYYGVGVSWGPTLNFAADMRKAEEFFTTKDGRKLPVFYVTSHPATVNCRNPLFGVKPTGKVVNRRDMMSDPCPIIPMVYLPVIEEDLNFLYPEDKAAAKEYTAGKNIEIEINLPNFPIDYTKKQTNAYPYYGVHYKMEGHALYYWLDNDLDRISNNMTMGSTSKFQRKYATPGVSSLTLIKNRQKVKLVIAPAEYNKALENGKFYIRIASVFEAAGVICFPSDAFLIKVTP